MQTNQTVPGDRIPLRPHLCFVPVRTWSTLVFSLSLLPNRRANEAWPKQSSGRRQTLYKHGQHLHGIRNTNALRPHSLSRYRRPLTASASALALDLRVLFLFLFSFFPWLTIYIRACPSDFEPGWLHLLSQIHLMDFPFKIGVETRWSASGEVFFNIIIPWVLPGIPCSAFSIQD